MMSENKIRDYYFYLKKIVYIEKDENGNILYTNNPDILSDYDEIIHSEIVENNQYYDIKNKKWYEILRFNFFDDKTKSFHTIEYIEDITNLKQEIHKLKLDSLTGLMRNREECNKLMEEYIQKAIKSKEEFSILIGDIDYFKKINDTYGHHCGDFILRVVSKILSKCTNCNHNYYNSIDNDIILRFGGDEFVILLKNISEEDTLHKIDEITTSIKNEKLNYNDQNILVTMSFGYAHFKSNDYVNQKPNEIREILSKKADDDLYAVKNNRNH